MDEIKKILEEEGITSYEVIEDKYENFFHRVMVRLEDGRTIQVNTPMETKQPLPKYEVTEERYENGCKYVTLQLEDGRKAHLRIPDHTAEEKAEIAANFTSAVFKMFFPNDDWSNTKLKLI